MNVLEFQSGDGYSINELFGIVCSEIHYKFSSVNWDLNEFQLNSIQFKMKWNEYITSYHTTLNQINRRSKTEASKKKKRSKDLEYHRTNSYTHTYVPTNPPQTSHRKAAIRSPPPKSRKPSTPANQPAAALRMKSTNYPSRRWTNLQPQHYHDWRVKNHWNRQNIVSFTSPLLIFLHADSVHDSWAILHSHRILQKRTGTKEKLSLLAWSILASNVYL